MSRNPHVPTAETRKDVRALAGMGLKRSEICTLIEISENTLRLYYRDELKEGKAEANAAVTEALLKLIREGNVGAAIFHDKCNGGPKEKPFEQAQKPWWEKHDYSKVQEEFRYMTKTCLAEKRCPIAIDWYIRHWVNANNLSYSTDKEIYRVLMELEARIAKGEQDAKDYVPCFEL